MPIPSYPGDIQSGFALRSDVNARFQTLYHQFDPSQPQGGIDATNIVANSLTPATLSAATKAMMVQTSATDIATPATGQVEWNSTDGYFKVYTGSAWRKFATLDLANTFTAAQTLNAGGTFNGAWSIVGGSPNKWSGSSGPWEFSPASGSSIIFQDTHVTNLFYVIDGNPGYLQVGVCALYFANTTTYQVNATGLGTFHGLSTDAGITGTGTTGTLAAGTGILGAANTFTAAQTMLQSLLLNNGAIDSSGASVDAYWYVKSGQAGHLAIAGVDSMMSWDAAGIHVTGHPIYFANGTAYNVDAFGSATFNQLVLASKVSGVGGQTTSGPLGVGAVVAQALLNVADTAGHIVCSAVLPAGMYCAHIAVYDGNGSSSPLLGYVTDGTHNYYFQAAKDGSGVLTAMTGSPAFTSGWWAAQSVFFPNSATNTLSVHFQDPSGTPNDSVWAAITRIA